ncbi:HNH endonuclease [Ktedonosporobacter rubrisoli]|uniref:HNH endonuclease n=1 Tax=Ktedonosporobacter rubrisoli TaxID=2509675 RepID=A0A4V0YYP4_KTERU|nr:HNH endonuclease [Ktedonosporobacter rubrisoli]QBD76931.1 HNH endonuclease [Ktedonosporobacter rubrisoli]
MERKRLRASVIASGEWFKDRDPYAWKLTRQRVLQRDQYTCTYCRLVCHKFMQVNHIGAEDNHKLDNLETVCPACHSVMHLGINALEGHITIFDCKPEVTNMAAIVCVTRALVAKKLAWPEIERHIYEQFALLDGTLYDARQTLVFADRMLASIPEGAFRGYLVEGKAVMFHEAEAWNGYPEAIWRWQCLPGSHYQKA